MVETGTAPHRPSDSVHRGGFFLVACGLLMFLGASVSGARAEGTFGVQAPAGAFQPTLTIGVSHARLHLPEIEFTHLSEQVFDDTLFKFENHDGEVDGGRLDIAFDAFALRRGSWTEIVSIKGFYAALDSSNTLICDQAPVTTNCTYGPLVQDNPLIEDKKDSNDDMLQTAHRDVDHWGVALESRFILGDVEPGREPLFAAKAGLAYKAINQDNKVEGADIDVADDVFTYDESLDTSYWGAFIGLQKIWPVGAGFSVLVDGEVGLYYADTDYSGSFVASGTLPEDFANEQLSLEDQQVSAIGALRVEARKAFPRFTTALYGEAELYSYIPKMDYKDTEIDILPVTGFTPVTRIERGSAVAYSLGGRVSVPIGAAR